MSMKREDVLGIAEKYGAFEFGDAQGDKRLSFAADVITAHQRIRDAAPELLELVRNYLNLCEFLTPDLDMTTGNDAIACQKELGNIQQLARAALNKAGVTHD